MLFPRDPGGHATSLELVQDPDGFPVLLATGLLGAAESGLQLLPHGPGLPLLGEHARGLHTRPHLRGHRAGGRDWSTLFSCTSLSAIDQALHIELEDKTAALRVVTEAETAPGRHAAAQAHRDQRRPRRLPARGTRGRASRHRTTSSRRSTSPVGTSTNVTPNVTRSSTASGCASRALGAPGWGQPPWPYWARPASRRRTARCSACTSPGAATRSCVSNATRRPAPPSVVASCLLPGEVRLASGDSYSTPWVHVAAATDGLDGLAAVLPRAPAVTCCAPPRNNRWCSTAGRRSTSTTTCDRLKEIAERAASVGVERFVLDDGWFLGRRDDTVGLGDWTVDPTVWPEGLTPVGGACARARDAVRFVDRAGDGQPRLRPLPRPSRLDPRDRRPGAAPEPEPARAGPLARRGARPRLRPDQRGVVDVRRRRGEVGPQPRPARRRQRCDGRRSGGAPPDARFPPPARRPARGSPTDRLGVVRVGRWTHRPRGAREGATGVDLRHDRCAGAAADPAVDHPARRPGVRGCPRLLTHLAHDGANLAARLPRGHGALRIVRHRVGPVRGDACGALAAGGVDRALSRAAAAASLGPSGAPRVARPGCPAPRRGRRRTARRRSSPTCSWTSPRTTEGSSCACQGSTPTRRTT